MSLIFSFSYPYQKQSRLFEVMANKPRPAERQKHEDDQDLFNSCTECSKTFVSTNSGKGPFTKSGDATFEIHDAFYALEWVLVARRSWLMHDLAWDLVGCMFRMASSRSCARESSIVARIRSIRSSSLSHWVDKTASTTARSTAGLEASEPEYGRIRRREDAVSVAGEIRVSYIPLLLSSHVLPAHSTLILPLSPVTPSPPYNLTAFSQPSRFVLDHPYNVPMQLNPSSTTWPAPSSSRTT